MKPVDPRLLRYVKSTKRFLIACVGIGVASAFLLIIQASLLAVVISRVVVDNASVHDVRVELVKLSLVTGIRGFLVWLSSVIASRSAATAKEDLRQAVLKRVVELGPSALTGRQTGALAVTVTRGIDALDGFFSRYLTQLVFAAVVPGLLLVRMAFADVLSAGIIVLTMPLVPIFMILVGKLTQKRVDEQFRSLTMLSAHFLDLLRGMATLRLFNRADAQTRSLADSAEQMRRVTMSNLRIAFLSAFVLELVTTMGIALVAVSAGLRLVNGEMTFESALVVLLLAPDVYLPLRQVGSQYHANAEGVAAADVMFAILERSNVSTGSQRAVSLDIEFDKVTIAHESTKVSVLKDCSFVLREGERLGLVGPSGCGKSTALQALLGFIPVVDGHITVGGVDLQQLQPNWWRSRIAYVSQRSHVFNATIAENVRIGRRDASDADVTAALEGAMLWDVVRSAHGGINAAVGERGGNLSAGERQRLVLARAFLCDAPIVLLDEPMANLDSESEVMVSEALRALLLGRTAIVVSHRIESLMGMVDSFLQIPMSSQSELLLR